MSDTHKPAWREYIETIVICVLFVLFARTFAFQQSKIPTGSMEQTLLPGDYILVDRLGFPGRQIDRGDVVVFKYPLEPEVDYIKRVIGLPGDIVQVRPDGVHLNGELIDEPYVAEPYRRSYRETAPQRVAEGHLFVMGDHRNDSLDSRVWGQLPQTLVKGRAVLVWWSFPEANGAYPTANQRVQGWGDKLFGFFTRSRWDRCMRRIR